MGGIRGSGEVQMNKTANIALIVSELIYCHFHEKAFILTELNTSSLLTSQYKHLHVYEVHLFLVSSNHTPAQTMLVFSRFRPPFKV